MATTPNYGFTVYASTDTAVKFLDFRTSIAGTATSSNFYKIDTLLKTINDSLGKKSQINYVTVTSNSGQNYLSVKSGTIPSNPSGQYFVISVYSAQYVNISGNVTIHYNDKVYTLYNTVYTASDPGNPMELRDLFTGQQLFCYAENSTYFRVINISSSLFTPTDTPSLGKVLITKENRYMSGYAGFGASEYSIGNGAGQIPVTNSTGAVPKAVSATNATNATNATTAANANKLGGQSPTWYMPTGAIVPYAGSTAPDGWLLCDGTLHQEEQYPELYAVIGERYGADKPGSFRVPDLRKRVPAGASVASSLGQTTGSESVTLTIDQMPSHVHSWDTWAGPFNDAGGYSGLGGFKGSTWQIIKGSNVTYEGGNGLRPTGGGQAHNNMQPTIYLNYIIKY